MSASVETCSWLLCYKQNVSKLGNFVVSNSGTFFDDAGSNIITFLSNDMGFNNVDLNNINLNDYNFDEDDLENFNQARF